MYIDFVRVSSVSEIRLYKSVYLAASLYSQVGERRKGICLAPNSLWSEVFSILHGHVQDKRLIDMNFTEIAF